MAFDPKPEKGIVYLSGDTRYKVVSFNEKEVVVIRLKSGNSEDSSSITWTEKKWNGKNLKKESGDDGDKPEKSSNSFTFDIDDEGNLTISQNGKPIKQFNVRGPEGKPGKDGSPGQDGAHGQPGKDGATGQPGRDGTPGKDGHDGEPGPEGKQGVTGPKGEDGVYWYPEISDDGTQLRFKNRNDPSDVTEWYNIKGSKGETGSEGPRGKDGPAGPVFIPSVNSDGDLSWSNTGDGDLKNPPTRNIKGDKGDTGDKGATFYPIVKDGILYWYDDKGNFVERIAPAKIIGPQGKNGEQGKQGLSAYEIWLKQGYIGTEQDFLDSLKGEKGTPAPPANFSYKDVKDFKCDVQKIDTNLLVDSVQPTDSPEKIINDGINEIKTLRENGHKKENRKKYNVNILKKFFWWCAGADKDLITICPGDHTKYVGMGTVIFFTALMACFSSFIAMRLVFGVADKNFCNGGTLGAGLFALFWGAMIFCLDRFITNTMYSDGKVTISKKEIFSGLPRIVIAIFLGIVISAPLELKIFDQEIKKEIVDLRMEDLKNKKDKDTESIQDSIISYKDTIQSRVGNSKKLSALEEQMAILEADIKREESSVKVMNLTPFRQKYIGEDDGAYQSYLNSEANRNKATQKVNQQNKSDAASDKKKQKDTLQNLIVFLSGYTDTVYLANRLNEFKQELKQKENEYTPLLTDSSLKDFSKKAGLKENLHALHSIAMKDYKPWFNGNLDTLDTILHTWWWYLFNSSIGLILLLFILIDVSPVLYKMMLSDGKYDNYLHQEKLLSQDKIRLSLSNMLKGLNDSELKRVAPFIMGDIYEKMSGDSYIYKTEEEFKEELAAYEAAHKKRCWIWRIRLFSMIRWIFWKEEDKPTAPVIVLNPKEPTANQQAIIDTNNEVFEEVLEMKKKIVLASYRRWYKTQHDCIICDDVDDGNKERELVDDEFPGGDDSEINMKNEDDFGDFYAGGEIVSDDMNDESSQTEDMGSDDGIDDEQELPNDDGDDNIER